MALPCLSPNSYYESAYMEEDGAGLVENTIIRSWGFPCLEVHSIARHLGSVLAGTDIHLHVLLFVGF